MNSAELETYLHEHIPISQAMGVSVVNSNPERVTLAAPLGPNINHRDTVFGGSASALAILAGWSLVRIRIESEGIDCRIVIRRSEVDFELPIEGEFIAEARLADDADWSRFVATFRKKGKARIPVWSSIECEGVRVGSFKGEYVALAKSERTPLRTSLVCFPVV